MCSHHLAPGAKRGGKRRRWHRLCCGGIMTTVAIPHWQGRVSPVFDVAGNVLVVEFDDQGERARQDIAFCDEDPRERAAFLAGTGAEVLICGAISWPLQMAVSAAGIEVISQTCGDVEAVLEVFRGGDLASRGFLMPGCGGRRGPLHVRCTRKSKTKREVNAMPRGDGTGPTGRGPGTGRGRGMGQGRSPGRMGGVGLGPAGSCACPSCGKRVPHQRGTPCTQRTCPDCGATMNRDA